MDPAARSARRRILTMLVFSSLALLQACGGGSTDVTTATPTPPDETAPTGPTATGATGNEPSLEGTWSGTWTTDGAPLAGTFTLEIAATAGGFEGTIDIEGSPCVSGGTVEIGLRGDRITFGVVGAEERIAFKGTVSTDRMSGTFDAGSCPPPNTGTWEAELTT